jgi:PAS domain S-box-containing protein
VNTPLFAAIFGIVSFAAGLVSLGNAVYLAPHWKTPSAGKLILVQVAVAIWAMAYAMEFFTPDLNLILWWVRVEYFGAVWVGLFLLDFVLDVSQKEHYLPRKAYFALCCLPLTILIMVLTNGHHHLIWERAWIDSSGIIPVVAYNRGLWFWVFVAFSYGLLLTATLVLLQSLARARGLLKKQIITILVGIGFPWLANAVYLLRFTGGPLPDLSPFAFTISGLAFAWGLMRYQMLSLIPLAHEIVIESMGDPVISVDMAHRVLDVNRTARTTFSLEKTRPGAASLEAVFPALHRELVTHAGPVETEIVLDAGNKQRDWDMRLFPLVPPKGKQSGWLILLRDITRRKKNQAALVESERIHRAILEAAPNPIVLYDEMFRVTHTNPAFTRVFGWDQEELQGKVIDFIPGENGDQHRARLRTTLEQRKIYDFITRRLTKDGDLIDVSINAALCRAKDGSGASMVVNFTDITDIKKTETALRNTRNNIRSIINSMPSILAGLDTLGNITLWNTEAETLTGIPAARAEGRPLKQVFPELSAHLPDIMETIEAGKVKKASRVVLDLPSGPITTDITVYPIALDTGQGAVVRADDISDRIRMEEMVVQSEKMLSVGGLAAGMAHEINNPLAGMLQSLQVIRNRLTTPMPGNLEAAEKSGIPMENLRAYLEQRQILSMMDLMAESGQRAAQIVSNMLSFSRKSGQTQSPHDLTAILDDTVELIRNDYSMKHQYDFKSIDVQKHYAENMRPVSCRRGELQQVLLNILKNGAEAMITAGTNAPCFALRCYEKQDRAVIEIRDNGPGMDAVTRKRLFEPFYTTKDVGLGTGLGLSVSYFIITENHNGTLEVESQPGKGAAFIITLP